MIYDLDNSYLSLSIHENTSDAKNSYLCIVMYSVMHLPVDNFRDVKVKSERM